MTYKQLFDMLSTLMFLQLIISTQISTVVYLLNNFDIELQGFSYVASIYTGTVKNYFLGLG